MTAARKAHATAESMLPAVRLEEPNSIDELPLPYVEIDSCGIITHANRASIELHPAECGELVGKMAWDLVASDEKDPSFAAYCASLEKGDASAVVRRSIYGRSGQFRTYDIYRSLMRNGDGTASGMRMVCVDVTDTARELNEARRQMAWLENVVESVAAAIVVADSVGFIRSANPAAAALLGWNTAEMIGLPLEEGLPIWTYRSGDQIGFTFTTTLEGPSNGVATVLDHDRRELNLEIATTPIVDKETGSTTGVALVLQRLG